MSRKHEEKSEFHEFHTGEDFHIGEHDPDPETSAIDFDLERDELGQFDFDIDEED